MTKFKVGDRVEIEYIRSADARTYNGRFVTIGEIRDGVLGGYFLSPEIEDGHGSGIWMDEIVGYESEVEAPVGGCGSRTIEEVVNEKEITVLDQRIVTVKDRELTFMYTTNTKKDRISIHINGNKATRIAFKDIDRVIEALTELKSEV